MGDEKKVLYRKRLDSEAELSVYSPDDLSAPASSSDIGSKSIQKAEKPQKPIFGPNAETL